MRVELEASVFSPSAVSPLQLCSLFEMAYSGRFRLLTQPAYDPNVISVGHPVAIWLQTLDPQLRAECELALEFGLVSEMRNPSRRELRISANSQPDWSSPTPTVPLSTAVIFLQKPFRILVENNRNDRAFLLSVAEESDRTAIEQMEAKHWLIFEHTGGLGDMIAQVKMILSSQEECFRAWILFDSDRLRPDQPNPASEAIATACSTRIPYHQLKRRSIENYLPTPVLGIRSNRFPHKVTAWNSLNREQRNHFNLKEGFQGDRKRADGMDAGTLYDSLNAPVKSHLDAGFGRNIAALFQKRELRIQTWYASDEQFGETQPMIKNLISFL